MRDPYKGLALSYLIDPRPVEYWIVQAKPNARRGWTSCVRCSSIAKANRELASNRRHLAEYKGSKKVFRITAHLN